MTPLAGLVPCADAGIRTTLRWASPLAAVIRADHQQPCQLALGARVRLQRHRREARDLTERRFELAEDAGVARRLIEWRKRVHLAELGPRHGQHLGRGVQLHGARPERDHRGLEPDVLRLEAADIPHHLRLGVVLVEHRVCQVGARAAQRRGVWVRHAVGDGGRVQRGRRCACGCSKHGDDVRDVGGVARLVECDSDRRLADVPEVDASGQRPLTHRRRRGAWNARRVDAERVEIQIVHLPVAHGPERMLGDARQCVDACRNRREALRAVINGIHRGHVGKQRLRRADVRGRFLAPDVLFARLEGHAIRRMPVGIDRHADDASRRLAHIGLARSEERRVRPSVPERHTEAL